MVSADTVHENARGYAELLEGKGLAVNEEWRSIIGYEGRYEVSNLGRVRPVIPRYKDSLVLKPDMSRPYPRVALGRDGVYKHYLIHRLVAEAFIGPLPVGCQVHHIDCNHLNCAANNLCHLTASANMAFPHRGKGKLHLIGEPIRAKDIPDHEVWLPIPGYEGLYEVSSEGNIRRDCSARYSRGGLIRKPAIHNGYHRISLPKNGGVVTYKVAYLVTLAFIGPRPNGWFVNHRNGNKLNDGVFNLEYVTPSGNVRHAFSLGLRHKATNFCSGSKHQNAKLSEENVRIILTSEEPKTVIARRFHVSPSNIAFIRNRKSWVQVEV